jgi:hypothetical protein
VAKSLKSQAGGAAQTHPGAGVMGPAPSTSSSESVAQQHPPPPPPPPPSNNLLRQNQVNSNHPHSQVLHVEGGDHPDTRSQWLPKMNFPVFDGTDARIWVDKCAAYFAMYQIPPGFRVSVASIHMTGAAAHWFQSYKHMPGFQIWDQFVLAVIAEFKLNTHRAKTMELLNLRQTGSMDDYHRQFEQLVYNIRLFDKSLSTTMLTAQFLLGLKAELRSSVEMQLPDSVAKATILASVQEQLLDRTRKSSTKFSYTKPSILPERDGKSSFSASDMWKARQLKEYRRTNGLCYKCGEKIVPGHKCSVPQSGQQVAQLHALVTNTA